VGTWRESQSQLIRTYDRSPQLSREKIRTKFFADIEKKY